MNRYPDSVAGVGGQVLTIEFDLAGQTFVAMNGGDSFSFAQGISLSVQADTQEEIDHFYEKLSEGGEQQPCGWLTDRFGVSWQVTPRILPELLFDKDQEKAKRAMDAMMKMKKIIIEDIIKAKNNGTGE